MKKFAGLAIAALVIFCFYTSSYAEKGFTLNFAGNSYKVSDNKSLEAALKKGGFPFSVKEAGGNTVLSDPESGMKVAVRYDVFDDNAFQKLRDYYNDDKSTKNDLFARYVNLQKSYILTLKDYYRTAFLYGEAGEPDTESNMKLFYSGAEKLFGQESQIYLYNTEKSEKLDYNETTHLDLLVPVPSKYAFISIKAEQDTCRLDTGSLDKFRKLLGCLRFDDLQPQTTLPLALSDQKLLAQIYAGIYPERSGRSFPVIEKGGADSKQDTSDSSHVISDSAIGFSISVPDTYVPYIQNSLGGKLYFNSFKITPNQIFSVTSELSGSKTGSDKIDFIKNLYKSSIKIVDEDTKRINGRTFNYLAYDLYENGSPTHIIDYFTSGGKSLYTLELRYRFEDPSQAVLAHLDSILASFETGPEQSSEADTLQGSGASALQNSGADALQSSDEGTAKTADFVSRYGGYGFSYPEGWKLIDTADGINYDAYKLVLPELSGPLDITISEGELKPGLKPGDIPACLSGLAPGHYENYVSKYTSPYKGTISRLLDETTETNGEALYLYRLVSFIDPNGRNRLSYTVDIVRGLRIETLNVTLGEYLSAGGRLSDSSTGKLINDMITSFRVVETPEYKASASSGVQKNDKLAFVENKLSEMEGPGLTVTSVTSFASDGSFYLTADNSEKSGYYKLKLDYPSNELEIIDVIYKNDILNTELEKLYQLYGKDTIKGVGLDERNMVISLETSYFGGAVPFTVSYSVNVDVSENGITWKASRFDHPQDLKQECSAYLKWLLGDSTKVYFAGDEFENIESYDQKGFKYEFAVYLDNPQISGYFTISVDPVNDSFTLLTFKPVKELVDNIYKNSGLDKNYVLKDFSLDDSHFFITLTLANRIGESDSTGTASMGFRIFYDREAKILKYV